ncbi:C-GCAxxG-C-C family protein [Treponema sp.]|uniref:C-GCAxxG-C-C family protein n=1 Tax=Treponema sp. TaxID=166 RepID=UPI00388D53AF
MTGEQAREQATANFKSGMNCTQSVVSVFAEQFGFSKEMLGSFVQPFGGGMCRMREVCGTVSGMLFCLGMLNAQKSEKGEKINGFGGEKSQKDETYAAGQRLAEEFRKINGSIVCRELLGLEPKQCDIAVSEARTEEYYKKRPCAELCGIAAEIFQRYLDGELK